MNNSYWRFIILAVAIVFYLVRQHRNGANDTVDYQGEHFKLSKAYGSYEDYKDDPNNLDTNELERIEKVMTAAKLPSAFATREQFIHALFTLKFPGYGLGGIGDHPQTDDGSSLLVESVEIPQRDKDRYLVLRESAGRFYLVDDFISSTATNVVRQVKLQGGKISYCDEKGLVVREKVLPTK